MTNSSSSPNAVVLVPLDGGTEAEHALPTAIELAKRSGCVLLLARVLEPLPLGMAGRPYYVEPVSMRGENQQSRDYLGTMRETPHAGDGPDRAIAAVGRRRRR